MANFASSKTDLNLKYRLGLEHALARADFLNLPDLVLVQALVIFLCLLRRHDSPRFVWMMTGIVIRMAQALGMQRDGENFDHLTPFEIEMRRRAWWALCSLDIRASEDQGTEFTITSGSFDTKLPLHINDADIDPDTKHPPKAREGLADMTFVIANWEICEVVRRMMAPGARDGGPGIEEQSRLIDQIFEKMNQTYLRHAVEHGNIAYWAGVVIARLVSAKLTLFIYLPVLFSSPSERLTVEIRNKLLVAAIEVAEYNHALNAEEACRQWRWVFQTYTHWHAIVYILIEITRRPWTPIVERAWLALHSAWLIPDQSHVDKGLRIWIPLRRLMTQARKHRKAEVGRLRTNPEAVDRLETEDREVPVAGSSGSAPAGINAVDWYRAHWRQLVTASHDMQSPHFPLARTVDAVDGHGTDHLRDPSDFSPATASLDAVVPYNEPQRTPNWSNTDMPPLQPKMTSDETIADRMQGLSEVDFSTTTAALGNSDNQYVGPSAMPWLWADADPSVDVFATVDFNETDINMDLNNDVDWYNWVESAKGIELGPR
jgi:hypothetical protein